MRSVSLAAVALLGGLVGAPALAAGEPSTDLKAIWSSLSAEEQAAYTEASRERAAAPALVPRTAGDTCAAATHEVSPLPFIDANTTVGLSDDVAFGAACGGFNSSSGVGPDIAYRVMTDITCDVTVNMDPAENDLALWVVTDCADPVGGCVGGDDSGGNGTAEQVSFTATAGTDYFIVVDGFGGASDSFVLTISEDTATGCALVGPGFGSIPAPPGPIDFGTVQVGSPGTFDLVIQETGDADLTVSNPSFGGPDAGNFSIEPVFPLTIPDGGADETVELTCQPSTTGTLSATLTLETNDPSQPSVTYTLTCEGEVPSVLEIPTTSFWGLVALLVALAAVGVRRLVTR